MKIQTIKDPVKMTMIKRKKAIFKVKKYKNKQK